MTVALVSAWKIRIRALIERRPEASGPAPKHRRHGRPEPYTDAGIRRLPCYRCGRPASQQWQICADGNLYRPICTPCDIALNDLTLEFMGDPEREAKMAAYRERKIHA